MEHHYDAFISYRHTPLDSKVAADIQSGLERFPVPGALQKSLGKKRIGPIFRDKEELPSSTLSDDIKNVLKNSDYLIVICSTGTAESIWVQQEIEAFLQDHDRQHVLTVLADGEPRDVIPDTLCQAEARICDYRKNRSTVKQEELPRLAAAVLGCSYDELRHQQSNCRTRQIIAGFTAALLLVAAVAALAVNQAVVNAQQARQLQEQLQDQSQEEGQGQIPAQTEEQSRRALINESRYLAEKSGQLLAQGDRMGAIQLALAGLPSSEADNSRPLVSEALYALNNAVYPYHVAQTDGYLPKCMLKTDGAASYTGYAWYRFSPNCTRWMTADRSGQIYVFDLEQDTRIALLSPLDIPTGNARDSFLVADFVTEDRIVLYLEKSAVCWDLKTNQAVWTTEYAPMPEPDGTYDDNEYYCGDSIVDTEHGSLIAALYKMGGEIGLYQFDAATGAIQNAVITSALESRCDSIYIALSPDGTHVAVGAMDSLVDSSSDSPGPARLVLADLESWTYQMISTTYADVPALTFLSNDQLCVFTTDMRSATSSRSSFSYAVELYHFEDASLVWSSPDEVTLNREVGQQSIPSFSMQFWHRKMEDEGTQELLIAQFGGLLLLLDPVDGHMVQRDSFSSDILNSTIWVNGRLILTLQNGQMVKYLPDNKGRSEIANISRSLRGACFNPVNEEFLLMASASQDIVVMSNQLENPDGIPVDIDVHSSKYFSNYSREYRVLEERVDGVGDGILWFGSRLLFYTPFSDTPVAITDGDSEKKSFMINFSEDSGAEEDICYYFDSVDFEDYLCGWGLESNQKVYQYIRQIDSGEILGFHGNQILLLDDDFDSELHLIDPVNNTEKAIVIGDSCICSVLSPDGKYVAVVTYNYTEGYQQLYLVDVENWSWVEVPEELQMQNSVTSLYTGSLSFSSDCSKLAVWMGSEIRILDLNTMTVSQHVKIPCSNYGYNLFLNDHILLVYGDSRHLTSWDLDTQSVVMEDSYSDANGAQLFLGNGYFQAVGQSSNLYTYDENGRFTRYLSVGNGYVSPTGSEVLSCYDVYDADNDTTITAAKIYPLYTLDDLIAMANEILDGRSLTEAERSQYLID